MQHTEILLKEHVKNLGRCGDVVKVNPGYARNFLVPRGIGIPASAENKKAMATRRARLDAEEKAMFADPLAGFGWAGYRARRLAPELPKATWPGSLVTP